MSAILYKRNEYRSGIAQYHTRWERLARCEDKDKALRLKEKLESKKPSKYARYKIEVGEDGVYQSR